jgi:hypothetical protein
MDLRRGDLASDLARMRASRIPATRAVGDNFAFEENIGDERRNAFEASTAGFVRLEDAIAEYFSSSVQGYLRSHAPSTFKRRMDRPSCRPVSRRTRRSSGSNASMAGRTKVGSTSPRCRTPRLQPRATQA